MRGLCLIWLALLLTRPAWVGAAEPSVPPQVPGSPTPEQSTAAETASAETITVEAPEPLYVAPTLRDRIGRIWAPVLINGKGPYRLVLDTGATTSGIIPAVADKLGIPLEESNKVKLTGVTGSAMVSFVTAEQLEVGELLMQNVRLPVLPDVFGGAEGVLGANGFQDKRILIDFSRDLIRIARSRREAAAAGFTRLRFMENRLQLLMFEIRIGSVRTKAILDTGAQQSIGNQRLRELLLRQTRESRSQEIQGVTLEIAQGESMSIPTIALGPIEIRNMRANFGSMYIFEHWKLTKEPVVVLGMDVIGTLDTLVIDYKLREVQVRTRRT